MNPTPRLLRLLAALSALAPALPAQDAAPSAAPTLADRQQNLNTEIDALAAAYKELRGELLSLGAAAEDVAALESALQTLARLHDTDVPAIVAHLRAGRSAEALAAQKQVSASLRDLSIVLQQRQQELSIARRARDLVLRQAANRRRTDAVRQGAALEGARAFAIAEQESLQTEIRALADQVMRLRQDPSRKNFETLDRAAPEPTLATLRHESGLAAERTRALDFNPALASQLLLQDGLQRISTLGRPATSTAEAVQAAIKEIDDLIADQTATRDRASVAGADVAQLGWDQDKLTARADTLRPDVDALSAPAGNALREAADAMHAGRLKFAAVRDTRVLPEQALAIQRLQAARALLEPLASTPPTPPKPPEAEKLNELARKAQALAEAQKKLNEKSANTPEENAAAQAALAREQADLARQAAQLQNEARAQSPDAASDLGQAASLMAESNAQADTNPTSSDAAAQAAANRLDAAAQQLRADATQAAQQQAGSQIANAEAALQNAAQQLESAAQSPGSPQSSAAAQQAAQSLQEARANLSAASQGAPQDAESRKALSDAWQAMQNAQQQANQGQLAAAQQSAARAAEALQKVAPQGQKSQGGEGGMDNGHVENQGDKASEKIGVAGLTQADREAISAARRQPVPAAYSGMVETYYDALNETDR